MLRKDWYALATPPSAAGLEENILGVAVEDPSNPFSGAHTPPGPAKSKMDFVSSIFGTKWEDSAPEDVDNEPTRLYATECPWPKELINTRLYPTQAAEANGVQESVRRVAGAELEVKARDIIAAGIGVRHEELDVVSIPLCNRYDMVNWSARIHDLLDQPAYRRRLISLLHKKRHKDERKPRIVYIITSFISCSGMALNTVKTKKVGLKGEGSDPTDQVPIKIGADVYTLSKKMRATQYSENNTAIVALSYRPLSYMRLHKDTKEKVYGQSGHSSILQIVTNAFSTSNEPKLDLPKELPLAITDGEDYYHCFWIAKDGGKHGNTKAWFGEQKQLDGEPADTARTDIFEEDMTFVSNDGAEGDDDDYPPGWFTPVQEEDDISGQDEEQDALPGAAEL